MVADQEAAAMPKKRDKKEYKAKSHTREEAFEALKALREKYDYDAQKLSEENEASTRLLLIDRILELLGWELENFNPEHSLSNDPGFIDYLVSHDTKPQFVVEAKKRGTTFGHSIRGNLKKKNYKLNYIRTAFGPTVNEVIEQATRYSESIRIPYAVVTNGVEWIVLQTIPFGTQKSEELDCVYFGNILAPKAGFNFFWELLAKDSVLEGNLANYFSELNVEYSEFCQIPENELGEIEWTPESEKSLYLQEFYDYFLDEITDESRRLMLEHCFVSNDALDQYQGDLRRILRDTIPAYMADAEDLSPDDRKCFIPGGTGDKKGRVILVTGSVGCGKTTFVTKTLIEARSERRLESVFINLIDEIKGDPDNFKRFLWDEVAKGWKERFPNAIKSQVLKKTFSRQIKALKEGHDEDLFKLDEKLFLQKRSELIQSLIESPEDFLEASWDYYSRIEGKGIVVFLDNIDRASEEYQQLTYSFAHKLARKTGVTVIVTMREVTFFRGKEFGFLDVRSDDKVYYLRSPDLVQILSRRLQYAEVQVNSEGLAEGKQADYRRKVWRRSEKWEDFVSHVKAHIYVLKATFLDTGKERKLLDFLASIAWNDVRYFLACLRSIHALLGSEEKWSMSEVITVLMLAKQVIGHSSGLAGIYLPPHERFPCYFLKVRILSMLLFGRKQSERLQGASLRSIISFCRSYRYQERWTRTAIEEMVRSRLLECLEVPAAAEYTKDYEVEEEHSYRASPLAFTLLEYIQFDPVYLALLGNLLPFCQERSYKKFLNEAKGTLDLLAEVGFDRSGIQEIHEKNLGSIVAKYLMEALEIESPIGTPNLYAPEVTKTERKIKLSVDKFKCMYPEASVKEEQKLQSSKRAIANTQLPLFQDAVISTTETDNEKEKITILVPSNLNNGSLRQCGHEPKIFWALVNLTSQGQTETTGAEVTRVINKHLCDDLHKVEPTNISRALRGSTLQSRDWLRTNHVAARKKLYSLADGWKQTWLDFFDESPPDF